MTDEQAPEPRPRNYPFPAYPNGWFCVGYSDEIESGVVTPLHYFGRELVAWRDDDGVARIFDAHCPHLGAHFGYGGRVEGGALRCPFHAWRFDGEGSCVEIPYAKKIPPKARVRSWPACEHNGLVFMWYHEEGKSPDRELDDLQEYGSPEWGDYTRVGWEVRSRMYDMGENPVDAQHFKYLHGGIAPTFKQESDGHGGKRNVSDLDMPTPKGAIKGSITSESYGPGFGVVHVRGVLHTIIVMANTPIDDQTVKVRFSYLQPATDDPKKLRLGQKMIAELKRQMDQDIVIFEHKKYLTRPCLVKEDGPIAEYRRKARRDYTGEFFND
ncbi:MAG: aromatic ring-hydroxylating dioxygenase subunit alpha [Deltaproteobacteria bacterium]|nr:aromatic ring-hydroxylating dioxygenase subunit alpha [Deltaproteobacteria bacterium]